MRTPICLILCLSGGALPGAEQVDNAAAATLSDKAIRSAVRRALPPLEKAARTSAEKRSCFTCHNQALPILALAEARYRGFSIDEPNFQSQLQHTYAHLQRGRKQYLDGAGQGGKVLTAGYALWALAAGDRSPDSTTSAVAGFILDYQNQQVYWSHPGRRPPSSGSRLTATYVALRALADYGDPGEQTRIDKRRQKVRKWLLSQRPVDTEDRVFRLLSLHELSADDDAVERAVSELTGSQRADGGWAQTSEMASDAYATGTALVSLLRTGSLEPDDPVTRRGVLYLLESQADDGTWHVPTRAEPFQTYYESGFPYGEDQFISISASAWSTLALLLALPGKAAAR